jgi:hypothetical protein
VAQAGRRGKGPGELTAPSQFFFLGDTGIVVFDAATLRLSLFRSNGSFISSIQAPGAWIPFAEVGDSLDLLVPVPPEVEFRRFSLTSQEWRTVLTSRVPSYNELFPTGSGIGPAAGRRTPSYAAYRNNIAVGDGEKYHILFFSSHGQLTGRIQRSVRPGLPTDEEIARYEIEIRAYRRPDGRPMSPGMIAAQLQRFRTTPRMYFRPGRGFDFDGKGRLWVFGEGGDSTSADVYNGTVPLGRIWLLCADFEGSVDVNGSWIVIGCGDHRAQSISDATIQLYHIEDGDRVPL